MRKMIHVEVGSELDLMLKEKAKKDYTTVSALVRNIIREYLGDPANETIWTKHKKKLTVLEREIQGVEIGDQKVTKSDSLTDDDFEQSLAENL